MPGPSMRMRRFTVCFVAAVLLGFVAHAWTGGGSALPGAQQPAVGPPPPTEEAGGGAAAPAAPAGKTQESEEKAGEQGTGHEDPFSEILLELALLIAVAWFGRWAAGRIHQPSVLGELIIGVLIGNIGYWLGRPFFFIVMHLDVTQQMFARVWHSGASVGEAAQHVFTAHELQAGGIGQRMVEVLSGPEAPTYVLMAVAIWLFSNLGVILLLLMVGLESSVEDMLKVGGRATMVAVVGVVGPFILGMGVGFWLMPEAPMEIHLFIAATLAATSVGITARVFKDLDKMQTREAKIILGAAVIDDVLGLVVLAVVVGIVATGGIQVRDVGKILALSVMFLGGVILLGDRMVRATAKWVHRRERKNVKLLLPLFLGFAGAWLSNLIGLAAIVGAFAAGLVMSDKQFTFEGETHTKTIEEVVGPLEALFAPVFFVLMGLQVNLSSFARPGTLGLALALIVAAIVGKLVSGWVAGKGMDKLSVGIGMIPRGEVGLIFASIGKGLGVVSDSVFSAIVMMVIVTTLMTPIALKWSLFRKATA